MKRNKNKIYKIVSILLDMTKPNMVFRFILCWECCVGFNSISDTLFTSFYFLFFIWTVLAYIQRYCNVKSKYLIKKISFYAKLYLILVLILYTWNTLAQSAKKSALNIKMKIKIKMSVSQNKWIEKNSIQFIAMDVKDHKEFSLMLFLLCYQLYLLSQRLCIIQLSLFYCSNNMSQMNPWK